MGKKGNWFSALKRAFTSSSKGTEKKYARQKKGWGSGKPKNGEVNSFIPLHREPSSVEKILGDAEREHYHKILRGAEREQQHKVLKDAEREQNHKILGSSTREHHHKVLGSTEREQQHKIPGIDEKEQRHKATRDAEREQRDKLQQTPPQKAQRFKKTATKSTVTHNHAQVSAIKIQTAYRGYMARKSYRALKGLVRLQGVMNGQSVKRQTVNTMRCMQMLVRVQSQIRARRLQMMEGRNIPQHKCDKEAESSKWSLTHHMKEKPDFKSQEANDFKFKSYINMSEGDANDEWDDSVLTKEEIDARMQRKVEAVIKRERALAYAYSHQVTSKSAHAVLSDIRSGGYSWWWNWLERHLPADTDPAVPATPKPSITATYLHRPRSSRSKPSGLLEASTPRSAKPLPSSKHPRRQLRDDDSLTSCPAYTVPRYMAPTASAQAKVRSNTDEDAASGRGRRRRFSFGLGTSIGTSLTWGKGVSLFAGGGGKEAGPPPATARHRPTNSIGGMSMDSTVSLPAGFGRRPFR